jgi:mutator protein MutT
MSLEDEASTPQLTAAEGSGPARYRSYVSAALLLDTQRRVLVRRRGAKEPLPTFWELPGGRVQPGETPSHAATRELREEVGISATARRLLGIAEWSPPGHEDLIVHFFQVESDDIAANRTSTAFVPIDEAAQLRLLPPDHAMITALLDAGGDPSRVLPRHLNSDLASTPWDHVWTTPRGYADATVRRTRMKEKLDWFHDLGKRFTSNELILDLGCGPGYAADALRGINTSLAYFGIDRSSQAISQALANGQTARGREFLCWQRCSIPYPSEFFGTVLAFGILEHEQNLSELLREIHRVMLSGGELLVVQSSLLTWFYPARMARRLLGIWPYGYQKNMTRRALCRHLEDAGFQVLATELKHSQRLGDGPLPVADRITGLLWPSWQRYVVARTRKA